MAQPVETFTRAEADKIVGGAIKEEHEQRDRVTRAEVDAIAAGVDVTQASVDAAIRRERAHEAALRARRDRWRSILHRAARYGVVGMLVLAMGYAVIVVATRDSLEARHAEVLRARSAVDVAASQRATVPLILRTTSNPAEVASLLAGVERRVYVAQRDYDTAARDYNAAAEGWLARRAIRSSTLPASVPYATTLWVRPSATQENPR